MKLQTTIPVVTDFTFKPEYESKLGRYKGNYIRNVTCDIRMFKNYMLENPLVLSKLITERFHECNNARSFYKFIDLGFHWHYTLEGYDFWAYLSDEDYIKASEIYNFKIKSYYDKKNTGSYLFV